MLKLVDLQIVYGQGDIAESRRFNSHNQFLSALILRTISPFDTGKFRKIHFELGREETVAREMLNVIVYECQFDFSTYNRTENKRHVVFDTVKRHLILLSKKYGWDSEVLIDRLMKLEGSNLDNIFEISGTRKISPDRKRVGWLKIYWDEMIFRVVGCIMDRTTTQEEEFEILSVASGEYYPQPMVSGLSWIGNDRIRLHWGKEKTPGQETIQVC